MNEAEKIFSSEAFFDENWAPEVEGKDNGKAEAKSKREPNPRKDLREVESLFDPAMQSPHVLPENELGKQIGELAELYGVDLEPFTDEAKGEVKVRSLSSLLAIQRKIKAMLK